ncbi:helix-turn-helix domain-containing protein [Nocardia miyunensis]|uniref:helix-turn-helix domain-containing protein n=1 Tax=Nocardia miyunensis TaxID=282684 RepID=UPI0008358780|nr:helix-turn-helix transcriptional regulator [Nocardia miyunensis]
MSSTSPTVARLELVLRIKQRREHMDMTGVQIANALGFSNTYWTHVEKYRNVLTETNMEALMDLLEIEAPEEREDLLSLRSSASKRDPWADFSGLFGEETRRLFGLESGAQSIRTYSAALIPGLLQSEEYARALVLSDSAHIRRVDAERYVAARMRRQERLSAAEKPLEVTAIVSEAALRQEVGGPQVLKRQLQHVIDLCARSEGAVQIRVLPFSVTVGAIVGAAAAFHLLDFPGARIPTIGWHESINFGSLIEDDQAVQDMSIAFGQGYEKALNTADSLALMEKFADDLS